MYAILHYWIDRKIPGAIDDSALAIIKGSGDRYFKAPDYGSGLSTSSNGTSRMGNRNPP